MYSLSQLNSPSMVMKSASITDRLKYDKIRYELSNQYIVLHNLQDKLCINQVKGEALLTLSKLVDGLKTVAMAYHQNNLSSEEKSLLYKSGEKLLKEIKTVINDTTFNGKRIFDDDAFEFIQSFSLQYEAMNSNENLFVNRQNSLNNQELGAYQQTNDFSVKNHENMQEDMITISGSSLENLSKITLSAIGNIEVVQEEDVLNSESPMMVMSAVNEEGNSGSPVPVYKVKPPIYSMPDQNGYTGYKIIFNENGKLLYEGELKNGKFNGYGTLYGENGNVIYAGDWKNGLYDGWGTAYYEDGSIQYQGYFDEGELTGWGTYYHRDGSGYQGFLKKGYREGWGTTTYSNGEKESKIYFDYLKYGKKASETDSGNSGDSGISEPPPSEGNSGNNDGGNNGVDNGSNPNLGDGSTTNPVDEGNTNPTGNTGETGNTDDTNNNENGASENEGNHHDTNFPPCDSQPNGDSSIEDNPMNDDIYFLNMDWIKEYLEKPIQMEIGEVQVNECILESRLQYQDKVKEINEKRLERIESETLAKEIMKQLKESLLHQVSTALKIQQYKQSRDFILQLLNA